MKIVDAPCVNPTCRGCLSDTTILQSLMPSFRSSLIPTYLLLPSHRTFLPILPNIFSSHLFVSSHHVFMLSSLHLPSLPCSFTSLTQFFIPYFLPPFLLASFPVFLPVIVLNLFIFPNTYCFPPTSSLPPFLLSSFHLSPLPLFFLALSLPSILPPSSFLPPPSFPSHASAVKPCPSAANPNTISSHYPTTSLSLPYSPIHPDCPPPSPTQFPPFLTLRLSPFVPSSHIPHVELFCDLQ